MNVAEASLSLKSASLSKKSHKKSKGFYRIITVLLGWVPLSLGIKLRNFIYPTIFAKVGSSVQIEPSVNFTRTYLIH